MNYHYPRIIALVTSHIFSIVGIFHLYDIFTMSLFYQLIIWHTVTGFGITAGAHRLWSHKSFKATIPAKVILMILNSICNQGHLIYWCKDHRTHHRYSDTLGDPHSSTHGFFYSHIGWLFYKKPEEVKNAGKNIQIDDLYEDKVVMFQYMLFPYWNLFWCFGFPTIYGKYVLNSYWSGFIIFGVLRWMICLHSTWCVNSIAHFYGYTPYKDIPPRESLITSIVALGEGSHNYHHTYPYDYATSEYGILKNWNPTKLFIDLMYYCGLVYDLKRVKNVSYKKS